MSASNRWTVPVGTTHWRAAWAAQWMAIQAWDRAQAAWAASGSLEPPQAWEDENDVADRYYHLSHELGTIGGAS